MEKEDDDSDSSLGHDKTSPKQQKLKEKDSMGIDNGLTNLISNLNIE